MTTREAFHRALARGKRVHWRAPAFVSSVPGCGTNPVAAKTTRFPDRVTCKKCLDLLEAIEAEKQKCPEDCSPARGDVLSAAELLGCGQKQTAQRGGE